VEWRELVENLLLPMKKKRKAIYSFLSLDQYRNGPDMGRGRPAARREDLMKRRERYNCEVPEDVLVLTAGVDTQDDRFEVRLSDGRRKGKLGH
jgi:phage terminase large subunit GpA-like protein